MQNKITQFTLTDSTANNIYYQGEPRDWMIPTKHWIYEPTDTTTTVTWEPTDCGTTRYIPHELKLHLSSAWGTNDWVQHFEPKGWWGTNTGTASESASTIYQTSDLLYTQRQSRRLHLHAQHRFPVPRNHRDAVVRAAKVSFQNVTPEEITALKLLRGLVSQTEFRRYLKYGFVRVQGASGLVYQITRNRHLVSLWDGPTEIGGLCIYLGRRYPPTDGVITIMLMVENDEQHLWDRANVRSLYPGVRLTPLHVAA